MTQLYQNRNNFSNPPFFLIKKQEKEYLATFDLKKTDPQDFWHELSWGIGVRGRQAGGVKVLLPFFEVPWPQSAGGLRNNHLERWILAGDLEED